MKKGSIYFLTFVWVLFSLGTQAQTLKGSDINGEFSNDYSGYTVDMPDAGTVAIGAQGSNASAGHVRVWSWNGTNWVQKGQDIDGEAANDNSGIALSMPDANTFAVGAPFNAGNGLQAGHVRVFSWSGTAWIQKGLDIEGEAADNFSGWSVSMPDANTLAVGAIYNSDNGQYSGQVRVFTWNGSSWVQKGMDLDGEATFDLFGYTVSMPDVHTIAVGAPGGGTYAGYVKVYQWNGTAWIQQGAKILGEAIYDQSGTVVTMPDVNTLAIGAPFNAGNGTQSGQVRVYHWNGTAWIQKGADMNGEAAGDESGTAISMPNANTIAIGAPYNDGNGNNSGHARIYQWNGTAWSQQGADINGEATNDFSGVGVCISDLNTIGIGGASNDGNGSNSGHVRVFEFCTPVNATQTINSCVPYTWIDGNTYSSNNNTATYTITGGAANGCDSIITLNFTIGTAPSVLGLGVSNIGDNTVVVNWNAIPGANMFQVRYRPVGAGNWTNGGTITGSSSSKTMIGLLAGTNYDLEVRAYCNPSTPGPWSTAINFTTTNICNPPSTLFTTNVTTNSALLNWSSVPSSNYYQIRYRTISGPGAWVNSTANGALSSKQFSGLIPNTPYEWQVRSVCNPSPFSTSPWSSLESFSTTSNKPGVTQEETLTVEKIEVYPNPAQAVLNVQISTADRQQTILKLYDLSGRLIKHLQANHEAGAQTISLPIEELSNGMYTLMVFGNEVLQQTFKISKQN